VPASTPTYAQLATASVPSLCEGLPATKLVNGVNTVIPKGQGHFELHPVLPYDQPGIVRGLPNGEGGSLTAVVALCDHGGVPWPHDIILFGPGPRFYAESFLSSAKWASTDMDEPARDGIIEMHQEGKYLVVYLDAYHHDDALCCPTASATVYAHANRHRLIVDKIVEELGD